MAMTIASSERSRPAERQDDFAVEGPYDSIRDLGVDLQFSTSEVAQFFDRTPQWVYWGLRNNVFTDEDGRPLEETLVRVGNGETLRRRRFTIDHIKMILTSCYRRGNFDIVQVEITQRRIILAENGYDWRDEEGWEPVVTNGKTRWVRPPSD